jgi:hypothetical protein
VLFLFSPFLPLGKASTISLYCLGPPFNSSTIILHSWYKIRIDNATQFTPLLHLFSASYFYSSATLKFWMWSKMQKRLVFRLPDKMHTKIGKAIKEGRAKNYSELIRTALEDYLKNT